MRRAVILSLCCLMVFVSGAAAQETGPMFSGAYLRDLCASNRFGKETVKGGHTACQAYIAGIVDYYDLQRSLGGMSSVDFCVPNTVKMNDLQDVLWAYLEKNAQHDSFGASAAVALALFEKYPCPRKTRKKRR